MLPPELCELMPHNYSGYLRNASEEMENLRETAAPMYCCGKACWMIPVDEYGYFMNNDSRS